MSAEVKGLDEALKKIRQLEAPSVFFDDVVSEVAVLTMNSLIDKTPYDDLSGLEHTKNMWEFPVKIDESLYQIDNTKTSNDGEHAIANILNKGRGPIRPKRAKRLYIPLSRKAKNRNKAYGAPIPEDFVWGKDYVLAKSAGPYYGTQFIDKIMVKSDRVMKKLIVKKIRKVFK